MQLLGVLGLHDIFYSTLICRFPSLGLRNYLRDNTCLISAEVSFDEAFVNSELPHRSVTSDNDSKLRTTAICVNLENLSRIDHVVTFVK